MSARRRMPAAFGRLWAGQTISELGSQVTVLALPLVAIKTLHAGPVAVGLLGAAETLPFLLIGLPAGAWVDRHRRRPLLLAMDLARAFVLVTVPVAYLLDRLVLAQLLAVALAVGVASVIFDVAAQAYVPALVAPGLLLGANARLETSRSAAQVAGPGLGVGRAVLLAAAFQGSWFVLVPLAPKPLAIPFIVLAMVGETSGNAALIVLHVSIRQAVTPPAMLGRMTATARFVTRGMLPIG